MFQLARHCVEFVFADDDVKRNLRETFKAAEGDWIESRDGVAEL